MVISSRRRHHQGVGFAALPWQRKGGLMVRAASRWVVLVILACASVGSAQPSPEEQAKEHFERGVALYEDGSMDGALVEFERAYELVPTYRLLFNLAQVQAESHNYVRARTLFKRYLAEGGAEVPQERREQVNEEIVRLGTWIAELMVETNVQGAQLLVDDVAVAQLPLAGPVSINSGIRRIRVAKRGYQGTERILKVAGLEVAQLDLALQPLAADAMLDAASVQLDADSGTVVDQTPFWVGAAVAGVFAGAAVSFALLASGADRALERKLDQFQPDPAEVDNARARLQTYAYLGDGFGAAAFVAAAVAVFFLVDPPRVAPEEGAPRARLRPGRGAWSLALDF